MRSRTVLLMIQRSAASSRRESRVRRCSSNWQSKIWRKQPAYSARFGTAPMVSTDGSRSRSRRFSHDTASTIAAAKDLHARAKRPNLFIKIPGTVEGLPAIEESIFAGVPVNVTLLFSREHYL